MLPLLRQVFNWEDRRHRADWDAGSAVNALGGVDVKLGLCSKVSLIFAWVNTVHRADVHARRVLGSDAGFSYDIRHGLPQHADDDDYSDADNHGETGILAHPIQNCFQHDYLSIWILIFGQSSSSCPMVEDSSHSK